MLVVAAVRLATAILLMGNCYCDVAWHYYCFDNSNQFWECLPLPPKIKNVVLLYLLLFYIMLHAAADFHCPQCCPSIVKGVTTTKDISNKLTNIVNMYAII